MTRLPVLRLEPNTPPTVYSGLAQARAMSLLVSARHGQQTPAVRIGLRLPRQHGGICVRKQLSTIGKGWLKQGHDCSEGLPSDLGISQYHHGKALQIPD